MEMRKKETGKSKLTFRRGKKEEGQEIIGIIGTGRSVGVTHFAIMTAGFLSGVLRRKCAVLEWNDHGDLALIRRMCGKEQGLKDTFKLLEVHYYQNAGIHTLLLCKKSGFKAIIVDYGTIENGHLKEFLRCDRQFLLGSLSEWQMEAFLEFERKEKKMKTWETFFVFGSEEARKNMEKRIKHPIRRIPVLVDAFSVTGEMIKFYQQIF